MFEKYNEKARRALFFARYEASKLGSRVIESEHVLLGVLREGEESITELFRRFHIKPEDLRREVEGERVFVERISSTAELPLSEESKKILAYASHEAESMLHPAVGSEHLLIGILRVEGCLAMRILAQHGFDVYTCARRCWHRQGARGVAAEEGAAVPDRVRRDLTALAAEQSFDPLIGTRRRRSTASSRSSPAAPRTTRSCSASRGWARRRSSRAWRSASSTGGCRSSSPASGSWRSTCR
jgi:ATP-dependent Clp protease ATP-binding subunit ClpC